jgi:hypothetical protein
MLTHQQNTINNIQLIILDSVIESFTVSAISDYVFLSSLDSPSGSNSTPRSKPMVANLETSGDRLA